jgi:hypothetical protein
LGDRVDPLDVTACCVVRNDCTTLAVLQDATSADDLGSVLEFALFNKATQCTRVVLEAGALWNLFRVGLAVKHNCLDVLNVVLLHSREQFPHLPSLAASMGHVRLICRMFDAGYPLWTSAADGEPCFVGNGHPYPAYVPLGQGTPACYGHLTLVVSSDVVRSGPVLLYAARKGVPLTPHMQGMQGDVRRRALALAGCFRRAARLGRADARLGPAGDGLGQQDARLGQADTCLGRAEAGLGEAGGAGAQEWNSMGRVPIELVQNIATLARISIVAREFV